jgi:PhoD related phosphatase/WW domain
VRRLWADRREPAVSSIDYPSYPIFSIPLLFIFFSVLRFTSRVQQLHFITVAPPSSRLAAPVSRVREASQLCRVTLRQIASPIMSAGGRSGRPDEEMFLNRQNGRESPTIVEPLRIKKRNSAASDTRSTSSQQSAAYPPPASSGSTVYPMPALPYPDGRAQQRAPSAQSNNSSSVPYPYPDPTLVASPPQSGRTPSPAQTRQNGSYTAGSGSSLAERRNAAPKPLPESPGPDAPDKDGLFQKPPQRSGMTSPPGGVSRPESNASQQYWPPPGESASGRLNIRDPSSVNRISSTASTSTTKAQRGSPPPPETPIMPPNPRIPTDIEARYAASGIAGTGTLNSLQAQSLAAQQRAAAYPQPANNPPRRPWTPTEQPGSMHPAPAVYQGADQVDPVQPVQSNSPRQSVSSNVSQQPSRIPPNAMENDMARLHVTDEPPPAYSQTPGQAGYSGEKGRQPSAGAVPPASAAVATAATSASSNYSQPSQQDHPAFRNDPVQAPQDPTRRLSRNGVASPQSAAMPQRTPSNAQVPPASPPPLPEGWIAHVDPNSGQYYYIHLPTQSTQWEFPKGPTPLNLNDTPLSPFQSGYQGNPLASPGLSFMSKPLASPGIPMTPGYDTQSVISMGGMSSTGFTGPPPSSGVDMYKVAPTNGVYFGPYLRYTNMDMERGLWLGSILLVTDAPQPPTIHLHQSQDLSPNPRQLKALNISAHQRWSFYKYEIDIKMDPEGPAKWTYAITSHLGCTRYEFLVAGLHESNWRFIATSGNDFSLNVGANERARLGGIGFMWKDIMQKHVECGGFHCQLGLGSQIYADRLWKEIPSLKQWLAMSGKENRKNALWTAAHEEDVSHAYFHYYTSHFDQPHLREAFAQIPHVLAIDDHDM